ncbi:MAG: S41 family peptidase [Clostridiales bacterium]|jgi:carboxyl-terminal processing protease|nr:S41 family peptidase [Clostridiales bacterium]
MNPWLKKVIFILAGILITAAASSAITILVLRAQAGERVVLSAEEFERYHALAPVLELFEKIKTEHYGDETTDNQLIDGALDGMLQSIDDPYAKYYTAEEYTAYLEQMDGRYQGIGALVGQPQGEGVPVLKVYKDSPAEKAGLTTRDVITAVDTVSLTGLSLEEIERLFSGDDGTALTVRVLRERQQLDIAVVRAAGTTQRVTHKLFLQRTGYMMVDKFTGTALEEFEEKLRDLTDRGMRSLVVDLRNNPGGELNQVIAIADMLLADSIIVTVRQANGAAHEYRADGRCTEVPLAILVNENSASASEILAAAVQDCGRGIVVGLPTFGKGVVQTAMQLKSNRGWVKLTTAAYYTPNGHSVDGKGVTPDIEIDLADNFKQMPIDQIDQDEDAQLWAALDEVREQADLLDEQKNNGESAAGTQDAA